MHTVIHARLLGTLEYICFTRVNQTKAESQCVLFSFNLDDYISANIFSHEEEF